jgi:hypothetical protein
MTAYEMLPGFHSAPATITNGYSLQAQHPKTGNGIVENFANLNSAVGRASELIGAGYSTEIWSPRLP